MGEVYDVYYTTAGNLHYCDTEHGGKDIVVRSNEERQIKQVEIVLKLPQKTINRIKSTYGHNKCCGMYDEDREEIVKAIVNGNILPPGHGRLIDESKIDYLDDDSERPFTFKDRIKNTSETIVEADKEGAENESDRCRRFE